MLKDSERWGPQLELGDPQIDKEHQQITGQLERLRSLITGEATIETLIGSLAPLFEQLTAHFVAEESLFETQGYPEVGQHKKEHQEYLDQARMTLESLNQNDLGSFQSQLVQLSDRWLQEHILVEDKLAISFINAQESP